jgi:diaminopropionate ammonia-lyase family
VDEAASITTVTASAGNHGRSVAWGSALFGCPSVVVLPEGAASARAAAIESHGATVEWFPGEYDEAVLHVERIAAERGWFVVSDTAYERYETIPRRIYEGYTLLADEVLDALREEGSTPPTHLFIQTGVGGLATGVCGHLWAELGSARPCCVAVEPLSADCFGRSIRAGKLRSVAGPFDTHMGGLASGVPSPLAWEVLAGCLDAGVAINDETSDMGAAALAGGDLGAEIAAGPWGASGVGALLVLGSLPTAKKLLGLHAASRLLVLVTETTF